MKIAKYTIRTKYNTNKPKAEVLFTQVTRVYLYFGSREAGGFYVGNSLLNVRINQSADSQLIVV